MKDNSSGFKGVSRCRHRWQAKILNRYIGVFDTEVEAACAYDREADRIFGKYARLNFARASHG